jgi:hypothetical protein
MTDGRLLERFADRDEAAFEARVRRHDRWRGAPAA